jgi:enterochelin esterase family protein
MFKVPNHLITALFCSILSVAVAQPPRGPFVISPQVHDDKTVTFSYLAPDAKEVLLSAQFAKTPYAMTKGEQGIWSVTVGPVTPDIYPYSFKVDGITVMDPANVAYFPNERFKASLVDIPGEAPLLHALQDVPHGTVTYEYYPSLAGSTGSLVVYTPPGYEADTDKRYPVFYLISGTTDTEETWFKVGKTNLILDNLIAQGRAEPMIIVMPYGNPAARIAEQTGGPKPDDPARGSEESAARIQMFTDDLVQQIIPYIEDQYRTLPGREARAIGGFSRGGGQTLRTAFGHLDTFAWICCYSAYLSTEDMENIYPDIAGKAAQTNEALKLLWVSVGDEDFLYEGTTTFMEYLKTHGVNFKSLVTDGGHTWMNTKKYLAATAPLLFK